MLVFSGIAGLLILNALIFAYKNPDGYELLLKKALDIFIYLTLGAFCFCLGIDLTVREFNLPYNELGIYQYVIPDFRYVWATPLVSVLLYTVLSSVGKLTKELQEASNKNS